MEVHEASRKKDSGGQVVPLSDGMLHQLCKSALAMEIDGTEREVGPGDAILIPAGARHQITARSKLRFLCSCSPFYDHADVYFD